MKLCQFCHEYTCSSKGSRSVSYECDKENNQKLTCVVFTNDLDKAQEIIFHEIEGQEPVRVERSQYRVMIETETEYWITYPLRESSRSVKPHKAYIDQNISLRLYETVIKPCCTYCLEDYPKYF